MEKNQRTVVFFVWCPEIRLQSGPIVFLIIYIYFFGKAERKKKNKSNLKASNKTERWLFFFLFKNVPLTFRYQPSQYLTFIKDKTVKEAAAVLRDVTEQVCGTASHHRNWMDLLGMPTTSPCRTGIHVRLISSDVARKQPGMTSVLVINLGKFGADILPNRSILSKVQLKNRMGLYRYANTEAAYSQGQKHWELVFSTVCLPVTSTLTSRATLSGTRSNLVLGLLAMSEIYGVVAFLTMITTVSVLT